MNHTQKKNIPNARIADLQRNSQILIAYLLYKIKFYAKF